MRPLQDCTWHSRTQPTDSKTHDNITVCSNVIIFLHSILNFRCCLTIHITFKHASYVPLPGDKNVTVDGCRLLTDLIPAASKLCSNISVSYGRTESQQGWQHINCNINALWRNYCCSEKEIPITYSEYVPVALGVHHTKRMCHTILLSVAVWLYNIFRYYLIQTIIFGKITANRRCVLVFFTTSSKKVSF
jgi:hypothetical protein